MPHVMQQMMLNCSYSILQDILSQMFDLIQSHVTLQKQEHYNSPLLLILPKNAKKLP